MQCKACTSQTVVVCASCSFPVCASHSTTDEADSGNRICDGCYRKPTAEPQIPQTSYSIAEAPLVDIDGVTHSGKIFTLVGNAWTAFCVSVETADDLTLLRMFDEYKLLVKSAEQLLGRRRAQATIVAHEVDSRTHLAIKQGLRKRVPKAAVAEVQQYIERRKAPAAKAAPAFPKTPLGMEALAQLLAKKGFTAKDLDLLKKK